MMDIRKYFVVDNTECNKSVFEKFSENSAQRGMYSITCLSIRKRFRSNFISNQSC